MVILVDDGNCENEKSLYLNPGIKLGKEECQDLLTHSLSSSKIRLIAKRIMIS
jgi:hypothetical protein